MIAPVEDTKNTPPKQQNQNGDKEMQTPTNDHEAQLATYQYANMLNSNNMPFGTLIGAAISPAIIPFGYYGNQEAQKPAKKKKPSIKSGSSSKKSSKDADRQVNISHITISPATPHASNHGQSLKKQEFLANPSYSPNQIASNEQAAYFNYLNTYSPNQNYPNQYNPDQYNPNQYFPNQAFDGTNQYGFSQQYPQSNGLQFKPLNNQNPYGFQNQGAPVYNTPINAHSLFSPYTPFNGYNPSILMNGNVPQQYFLKPSNSVNTPKPSTSIENSSLAETKETSETTESAQKDSNKKEPKE